MIELTDFSPLATTQSVSIPSRSSIDRCDHFLIAVSKGPASKALDQLPQGKQLAELLARAPRRGADVAHSRAVNARSTGLTVASFSKSSAFAALTWAGKIMRECLRDKPGTLGVYFVGLDAAAEQLAANSLVAAAHAAAFSLPTFKSPKAPSARLRMLRLHLTHARLDLDAGRAQALGNNVARWFTALPPNVLTAAGYRDAVERLAASRDIRCRFLGEAALKKLGAGAFLAVARGNATRDAGILHLKYRPKRDSGPALALIGKGVLFDTGGTNLKSFHGMLDMHTDMQGSAVALGTLLALAEMRVSYGIDAWLAITENRMAANSYTSQDLVRAVNGTTIQVIHTDAEGRMVLADTLALAARETPRLIVDYATLTSACVTAVTERYSGAFSNRPAANQLVVDAGAASGERIWPFPMDDDFDDLLKSDVADVKQCSAENAGDHILAARFLNRFVPPSIPWIHVDLSAGQRKGGLAHIPTEITGFGVRFTIELLQRQAAGPDDLAKRLAA